MSERELSVCEVCGWGNMRGEPMSCFKSDCPNPRERSAPIPARGDVDAAIRIILAAAAFDDIEDNEVAALLAALAPEREIVAYEVEERLDLPEGPAWVKWDTPVYDRDEAAAEALKEVRFFPLVRLSETG